MHRTRTCCIKKLPLTLPPVRLRRSVIDQHGIEFDSFGEVGGEDQDSFFKSERILRNQPQAYSAV
ncbi:hypothetical protein D3C80_2118200 [compost metagenome]